MPDGSIAQIKVGRTTYFVREKDVIPQTEWKVKQIKKYSVLLENVKGITLSLIEQHEEQAEKLKKKVTLHFESADLKSVLRYLNEVSGANIVLDEQALSDIDPKVTIRLQDISLQQAIEAVIRMKGLSYQVKKEYIWVTTAEKIQ